MANIQWAKRSMKINQLDDLKQLAGFIKIKWYELDHQSQEGIKSTLESIIRRDACDIKSQLCIAKYREDLSKCVVELMKHEWPNQWPDLTATLLPQKPNESVLLIFERLVNDIYILSSPSHGGARKELELLKHLILQYINNCLTSDYLEVYPNAFKTLDSFLKCIPSARIIPSCKCDLMPVCACFCGCVCTCRRECACIYTDFLKCRCDINRLIYTLCKLLGSPSTCIKLSKARYCGIEHVLLINQLACECLITSFSHGETDHRNEILKYLFSEDNIYSLGTGIHEKCCIFPTTQGSFAQLKIEFGMVTKIGQAALRSNVSIDEHIWEYYVSFMRFLFEFDNQILNVPIIQFWREFLYNGKLVRNVLKREQIEEILKLFLDKLIKRPYNDHSIGLNFTSAGEYDNFFIKFLDDLDDLFRSLSDHSDNYKLLHTIQIRLESCRTSAMI